MLVIWEVIEDFLPYKSKYLINSFSRTSRSELFCKKGVSKILQNLQENTCVRVSAGLRPATLFKKRLHDTGVLLWYWKFYRTKLVAASVCPLRSSQVFLYFPLNLCKTWQKLRFRFSVENQVKKTLWLFVLLGVRYCKGLRLTCGDARCYKKIKWVVFTVKFQARFIKI